MWNDLQYYINRHLHQYNVPWYTISGITPAPFFFVHTHLSLSQHFDNRRTLSEGYSFRAESLKLKSSCKLDAGYRDVRFHKVTFQNIRDAGATLKKKKKKRFSSLSQPRVYLMTFVQFEKRSNVAENMMSSVHNCPKNWTGERVCDEWRLPENKTKYYNHFWLCFFFFCTLFLNHFIYALVLLCKTVL